MNLVMPHEASHVIHTGCTTFNNGVLQQARIMGHGDTVAHNGLQLCSKHSYIVQYCHTHLVIHVSTCSVQNPLGIVTELQESS